MRLEVDTAICCRALPFLGGFADDPVMCRARKCAFLLLCLCRLIPRAIDYGLRVAVPFNRSLAGRITPSSPAPWSVVRGPARFAHTN